MNKKLTLYTLVGILFVSILGTLLHFVYEWSGSQPFIGLFSPVNESIWEHGKLLFFPMLLYTFLIQSRLKSEYPCILSALLSGILVGNALIPVLYYTYSGILGYSLTAVDIAIFYISVLAAFFVSWRLSLSCRMQNSTGLLLGGVILLAALFFLFTFAPPSIALFRSV